MVAKTIMTPTMDEEFFVEIKDASMRFLKRQSGKELSIAQVAVNGTATLIESATMMWFSLTNESALQNGVGHDVAEELFHHLATLSNKIAVGEG